MITRIGDHIIRDDVTNSRRGRIPTNIISTNKGTSSSNYCPECPKRPYNSTISKLIYYKESSAFVCPNCGYVRYVNPLSRNEMQPGTSQPIDAIPSLDGVTEQQAIARDFEGNSGRTRSKPVMRSIKNLHQRSQYSSENRGFSTSSDAAVIIPREDQEIRRWAENMNATILNYTEYIPQDSNTLSSDELRKKSRLEF